MSQKRNKCLLVEGSYTHELKIPYSWEFARFNEVIEIVGGSQPPKSDFMDKPEGDCVRLIQIRDYKSDNNIVYIPRGKAKRFVASDEVMIGRYGPPIFQILRGLEGAYNVALMKAKPRDGIFSNDYLYYYLSNKNIYNYVESASDRTAGQSGVNKKHLEQYPVGVPPLAEQKRIVEKLDEVLAQVDTIKARLDGIPDLLKRFRQSVLASAVSGKLTEDWRGITMIDGPIQKNLGDVITKIGQGWSPKCESTPAENGEWGVIKTSSVQNISFIEHENKALPKSLEARPEHELLAGDILTTRAGPRVRCGITAYVDTTRPNLMICDKVYRYQVKESEGFSKYLVYLLNSPQYLAEIEKMKTGISDSGMNLTQSKFKQLPLFWPHIEEQKEIIRLVDQYFAFADTIEAQVKKAQARVDNLTQSILAKAFRGELVPQNDDDEPADKLLERIAQARKEAEALAKAAKKAAKTKKTSK